MRALVASPESRQCVRRIANLLRYATWLCAGMILVGCKGSGDKPAVDETVGRYAQKGSVAYAEGQIDVAIREYRRAIHRAWAIDDPYESGTNAYNLAACMLSAGRSAEARDWLLDSRVELCRAGASAGNVYLLEAKLALHESRLEDVYRHVDQADCSQPPCNGEGCDCEEGPGDPCCDGCVTKIPCVGPKIKEARATKECENSFQAQVELTRARLAAEQYDIPTALRHLSKACELLEGICGHDLQADLHDVAALIHLAKEEYLQAACHLDREAISLRCAGIYREIPTTLELAAAAYEQAGRFDLAAKRLCRAARIWYGRGDVDRSWQIVQSASNLAIADGCNATQVRLALLAQEISQSLSEEKSKATQSRKTPAESDDLQNGAEASPDASLPATNPIDDEPSRGGLEEPLPAPTIAPEADPQTKLHLDRPRNQAPSELTNNITRLPSHMHAQTVVAAPASSVLPISTSSRRGSSVAGRNTAISGQEDSGTDRNSSEVLANRSRSPLRYFPGSPYARSRDSRDVMRAYERRFHERRTEVRIDPNIPSNIDRDDWPSLRMGSR